MPKMPKALAALSKMTDPVGRKEMAAVLLHVDPDVPLPSSSLSSGGKGSRPPNPRRQGRFQVCTANTARQQFRFLDLPTEIRLQIYDLLLVSRFDPAENRSLAVGETSRKTCRKLVLLQSYRTRSRRNKTIEPAILQTHRQIHHEAIQILYSQNVFNVIVPEELSRFMAEIGSTNFGFINSLDFWVSSPIGISSWVTMFDIVSEKATGLRFVKLGWGANCALGARGWGDSVLFVRALARIQGLDELHIKGYYAKNWPSYLKEKMSVQVRAERGFPVELRDADGPETKERKRSINDHDLQHFVEYQKGTEDLVP